MTDRLSELDVLAGYPLGGHRRALPRERRSPREVLEATLLEALQHEPCVVAFSGGRDSSAVLALAAHVARREGLPAPIPATRIYPGIAEADESEHQVRVIRHLGIDEWHRHEVAGEADALGQLALGLVRRHGGPLWPPVIHQALPTLAVARGGALVGGEGGDTVFGPTRASVTLRVATRRLRRSRVTFAQIARDLTPRPVRSRLLHRELRRQLERPWLRPRAQEQVRRALVRHAATEPVTWRRAQEWQLGARAVTLGAERFHTIAAPFAVRRYEPLTDPALVGALARVAPPWGFPSRREAMAMLFGDLLPAATLRRTDKADFTRPVFGPATRRFADRWDGTTRLEPWVDAERLREQWLAERPAVPTLLLLHHVWWEAERASIAAR